MRAPKSAIQRLLDAIGEDCKMIGRIRTDGGTCPMKPTQIVPTGILEIALGMVPDGKWWRVEIHYLVGNIIVFTRSTIKTGRMAALEYFKLLTMSLIFVRPGGAAVQRLYKQDDEYKLLQEKVKYVLKHQKPLTVPGNQGGRLKQDDQVPGAGTDGDEATDGESAGQSE